MKIAASEKASRALYAPKSQEGRNKIGLIKRNKIGLRKK
jgi:hypothetical protein